MVEVHQWFIEYIYMTYTLLSYEATTTLKLAKLHTTYKTHNTFKLIDNDAQPSPHHLSS